MGFFWYFFCTIKKSTENELLNLKKEKAVPNHWQKQNLQKKILPLIDRIFSIFYRLAGTTSNQ